MVRELLSQDASTIVITIGSVDTRKYAQNTLNTLKSFGAISKKVSAPVVMMYIQNSQTTSRSQADTIIVNNIIALSVLFSRENQELDTQDLFNWLRFDRVTSFPIQLSTLTLIEKQGSLSDIGNIISVATLANPGESTALVDPPEYQCVGFIKPAVDGVITERSPMNFVISDGIIPQASAHLQKVLIQLEQAEASRNKPADVIGDDDNIEESGLVL